jgi:large subunit ribosomal protein L2
MGKRIISQRRGKGSRRYRANSFQFKGKASHPRLSEDSRSGVILDFVKCSAHTAPLAVVDYGDETCLLLACEGMRVGDEVQVSSLGADASVEAQPGNILPLIQIPEGTLIYNIEGQPGDGGKFIRASGVFGRVVSRTPAGVLVRLPSRQQKVFHESCRAAIGVLAGGGRIEKPLMKAGIAHYKAKARNHLYPKTSASAMNAVDHPYGNKRTSRKSKAIPVSRDAPPGRKVGMVAARRTGRTKR